MMKILILCETSGTIRESMREWAKQALTETKKKEQ